MKHLLLCGHGYLGQAVTREFLAAGWQVTAISRGSASGCGFQPQAVPAASSRDRGWSVPLQSVPGASRSFTAREADLSSPESLRHLAATLPRPDFLVHCASSGRGGPDAYRAVYHDGCRHLVDTFPGVPLLFTSSSSVYPQTDGSEVTETSPAEPGRETGRILRQAETVVLDAGGLVFRLSGIYGPHRSVILRKFLAGEATIEEDGRRHLNQIHRDDAARAILLAATAPLASGIYNVSDREPTTQLATYRGLAELFDRPLPPSVPRDLNRKRGWTDKRVSSAKLQACGWQLEQPTFLGAANAIAATLEAD